MRSGHQPERIVVFVPTSMSFRGQNGIPGMKALERLLFFL
jgi:hypothetical protein